MTQSPKFGYRRNWDTVNSIICGKITQSRGFAIDFELDGQIGRQKDK